MQGSDDFLKIKQAGYERQMVRLIRILYLVPRYLS
jgi:hypothetical protein